MTDAFFCSGHSLFYIDIKLCVENNHKQNV